MKLKSFGGHFHSLDGGVTWKPKVKFKSEAEIRARNVNILEWDFYFCTWCDHYHLTKLTQEKYDE